MGDRAPARPPTHHVVVFDFGIKRNILRCLVDSGCRSRSSRATTSANGDPRDCTPTASSSRTARAIRPRSPTPSTPSRICSGRSPSSASASATSSSASRSAAKTYKLKFGHRGANQPVKDLATGRIEITTQNHGFCVDLAVAPQGAVVDPRAPERRDERGARGADLQGLQRAVPPRGRGGPARRALSLRPLHRDDARVICLDADRVHRRRADGHRLQAPRPHRGTRPSSSTAASSRAGGASRLEHNRHLGVDPRAVTAVVLSHAHIDHSGALPLLVKTGYEGPIYATPATRDLCAAMLHDAAMIQDADARFINKQIAREHADMEHVDPLYDEDDVLRVLEQTISLPYHREADHRAGRASSPSSTPATSSAAPSPSSTWKRAARRSAWSSPATSGAGRSPSCATRRSPPARSVLISESTYGDRLHDPIEEMDDALAAIVKRVHERGGKIVIPSFALERAQEIVFALKRPPEARADRQDPRLRRLAAHGEDHRRLQAPPRVLRRGDARAHAAAASRPFDFEDLRYISDKEQSKEIDADKEPAIIIAASGMCEAGRVLHHLKGDDRGRPRTASSSSASRPSTRSAAASWSTARRCASSASSGSSAPRWRC